MSTAVPEPQWADAGHGVSFWVWREHHVLYYRHDCPVIGPNPSAIPLDVPENDHVPADCKWQVETLDPTTISPSLLCRGCGLHGFIRDGRWEPC